MSEPVAPMTREGRLRGQLDSPDHLDPGLALTSRGGEGLGASNVREGSASSAALYSTSSSLRVGVDS